MATEINPVANTFNYCKVIARAFHATPSTIVLRVMPTSHNSRQRFPAEADVRSGTVYGPEQFDWFGYLTGTMVAGGGSAVFRPVGSSVVRRLGR